MVLGIEVVVVGLGGKGRICICRDNLVLVLVDGEWSAILLRNPLLLFEKGGN